VLSALQAATCQWVGEARPAPSRLMVFTDLDGTLLDHHSYDVEPALPALQRLRALTIPVVLTSSKTAEELAVHHQRLGLVAPFVFENGGGIATPSPGSAGSPPGYRLRLLGPSREHILATLARLRQEPAFRFAGFADWSAAEVASRTGLMPEDAILARQRLCSEPIAWDGTESALEAFRAALHQYGLRLVAGGRFLHVLGQTDKAIALATLLAERSERLGTRSISVALGDSGNDRDMLEAADLAVVVRRPDGSHLCLARSTGVRYTAGIGPVGWREAMEELIGTS